MGRVIPKGKQDRLTFLRTHIPGWIANAAELGLDAAQIAQLSASLAEAEAAYKDHLIKQMAARNATAVSDNAIDRATKLAASVILKVRGLAAVEESIGPFIAAGIPTPKKPVRAPQAPPMPHITSITMATGAISIKWTGSLSETDFFTLYRKTSGGRPSLIACLRRFSFLDYAAPLDEGDLQYFVVAQRRGIEVASPITSFMLPNPKHRAA
ncbi:MAG TPA: hypothetical protein VJ835_10005 [Fimbriimonadaceae bacterium]|nr:hypothetical protein [Fimbriimonadaceae bacterium]